MTGRNDPCPCGSGKKFKKCCGNNISALKGSKRIHVTKMPARMAGIDFSSISNDERIRRMAMRRGAFA